MVMMMMMMFAMFVDNLLMDTAPANFHPHEDIMHLRLRPKKPGWFNIVVICCCIYCTNLLGCVLIMFVQKLTLCRGRNPPSVPFSLWFYSDIDNDHGDDDGDDEDDEDNLNLPGCVLFNFLQKLTLYREGTPFLPCLLWLEVW